MESAAVFMRGLREKLVLNEQNLFLGSNAHHPESRVYFAQRRRERVMRLVSKRNAPCPLGRVKTLREEFED